MGLFGDKKKGTESLKTLSEKEIQNRLYGHLRTSDRVIQEDLPTLSKPRHESSVTHKSTEASKALTPSGVQAKGAASDLFAESPIGAQQRAGDEVPVKSFDAGKITSPSKIHFEKQMVPPTAKSSFGFLKPLKGVAGVFTQVLKQVIFKMVEAFATSLSALLGLIFLIDFRKPKVRRFFYSLAAGLVLVLVFTGIHHLNKNREIAMKSPHKKIAETSKKNNKTAHPAESLEAALNDTTAEERVSPSSQKSTDVKNKALSEAKKADDKSTSKTMTPDAKTGAASAESGKQNLKKDSSSETAANTQASGGAVIQVATFATEEDASKLVDKFKSVGFSSFHKSVSRSGGRVYYCVYIGKFQTQQEAEIKLAEFKKQEVARSFQDAFVRSL